MVELTIPFETGGGNAGAIYEADQECWASGQRHTGQLSHFHHRWGWFKRVHSSPTSLSQMYIIVNAIQGIEGSFCVWCKWSWREDNWLTWHPACLIWPYGHTCYKPLWICVQLKVNCFSPFVSRPSFNCACSSPGHSWQCWDLLTPPSPSLYLSRNCGWECGRFLLL